MSSKYIEAIAPASDTIRILFESLKDIFTEITLPFTKNGVVMSATNTSKNLSVYLILNKFDAYTCKETFNVSINCLYFYKMIKTCTQDDVISFIIENSKSTELIVKCENSKTKCTNVFKINLLDLDTIPPQPYVSDSPEYDVMVTIPSKQFQKICKNMYHLSDTLCIETTKQQISFFCTGDYASQKTTFAYDADNKIGFNFSADNTNGKRIISGIYDLGYLMLFNKSSNLTNSLTLFLKNNSPLVLRYGVANLGFIYFYVSQKQTKD